MAKAFPNSRFHGYDVHSPSIAEARQQAARAGVADRVTFEVASATSFPDLHYGLVTFFDCLHDLGDPVGAVRYAAQVLADDGSVMLVEPFAHDRVEDNLSPVARLYYSASTTICCAHAISEGGKLVLGAQAGEARLAEVFRKAGFRRFRSVVQTPFNMICEARK
jgi:ubiquinone/menaquinone biosynthesis C-methylase UbiE